MKRKNFLIQRFFRVQTVSGLVDSPKKYEMRLCTHCIKIVFNTLADLAPESTLNRIIIQNGREVE